MSERGPGRGKPGTGPSTSGDGVSGREAAVLERIEAFRRRRPRFRDDVVTLAHGAGGKASAALIDAVFLDAFGGLERPPLTDAALVALPSGETLAFTTDSFVVKPLRFPGGSIGHLAVHGTVNDLAVMGARPQWLSAAFVIEEGFAVSELRKVVADMSEAAGAAGVAIVTGDTKVVGRGRGRRAVRDDRRGRARSRPAAGSEPISSSAAIAFSSPAPSPTTAWRSCWREATWRSRPTSGPTPLR